MNLDAKKAGRAGFLLILPLFVLLLAAGCTGSANNKAVPFDPETGHPADFVTTHPTFAMTDSSTCTPCHGVGLDGGTSRVSCSASSWNGIACHAGGPGHGSQDWVDNVHFLRAKANLDSCRACHGAGLRGGTGTATSGPSCYLASFGAFVACHTAGPDHLLTANWVMVPKTVPDTVSGHQAATFADNGASCRACHAPDLQGTPSAPSCALAACHGNTLGPAFHPAGWLDCTSLTRFHGFAYQNLTPSSPPNSVCGNCHGVPATSPKCANTCHFNVSGGLPLGGTPQVLVAVSLHPFDDHHRAEIKTDNAIVAVCVNCHATHNKFGQKPVCHNCHPPFPGSASGHGVGWLQSHAPAARTAGSAGIAGTCGTPSGPATMACHGPALAGGSGPACTACHTGESLGVTANLSNCRTCHGNPPPGSPALTQPAGYPNIAGAHAKHAALAGVGCTTCHTGAGMTTTRHFDNVLQVAFATGYAAQSGTLGYTGAATRTCAATICHGGQTTPDWRRTPAALACTNCHRFRVAASPQFTDLLNSVHSIGDHAGFILTCTPCHNMSLVNHWGSLTDRAIPPGAARASILTSLNFNPALLPNKAACAASCH